MTSLSDLLWTIAEVPANKRQWNGNITAYHITKIENVDGIKTNGLDAVSCYQGYDRREAVYFFLDGDFSPANVPTLLGEVKEYAVITLSIPANEIKNMAFDDLYNASFSFAFGAAMIYRNVPANWIKKVEYRNA
jgi:hypothetical protein